MSILHHANIPTTFTPKKTLLCNMIVSALRNAGMNKENISKSSKLNAKSVKAKGIHHVL